MSCTVTPPLPFAVTSPSPSATAGGSTPPASTPSAVPAGQASDGVAALAAAISNLAVAVEGLVAALNARSGAATVGTAPNVLAGGANAAPTAELAASDPAPAAVIAPVVVPEPTRAPAAEPTKVDVSKWVKGDTKGLDAELLKRLAQVGERIDEPVTIVSGFRSRAEQQHLYDLYKAGKGNLAAKPGSSNHEKGNAADVNVKGTSLANNAKAKAAALEFGLHFPVGGEPWHTEVKK